MTELSLDQENQDYSIDVKTHEEILAMIKDIKKFEKKYKNYDSVEDVQESIETEEENLVEFKPGNVPQDEISLMDEKNFKTRLTRFFRKTDEVEFDVVPQVGAEGELSEKQFTGKLSRKLRFRKKRQLIPDSSAESELSEEVLKKSERFKIGVGSTIKLVYSDEGKLELEDKRKPKPKKPKSESKRKLPINLNKLKIGRKGKKGETEGSEAETSESEEGGGKSKGSKLKGIGGKLGGIKKIGNIKGKLPFKRGKKGKKEEAEASETEE